MIHLGGTATGRCRLSASVRGTAVAGRVRGVALLVGVAWCLLSSGCGWRDADLDQALVGTWLPQDVPSAEFGPDFDPRDAEIRFAGDGTWTASDPCNDLSGQYRLSGDGGFDARTDSYPGTGCAVGQVPYEDLLDQTDHVRFSDGLATFESSDDVTLLTLARA